MTPELLVFLPPSPVQALLVSTTMPILLSAGDESRGFVLAGQTLQTLRHPRSLVLVLNLCLPSMCKMHVDQHGHLRADGQGVNPRLLMGTWHLVSTGCVPGAVSGSLAVEVTDPSLQPGTGRHPFTATIDKKHQGQRRSPTQGCGVSKYRAGRRTLPKPLSPGLDCLRGCWVTLN